LKKLEEDNESLKIKKLQTDYEMIKTKYLSLRDDMELLTLNNKELKNTLYSLQDKAKKFFLITKDANIIEHSKDTNPFTKINVKNENTNEINIKDNKFLDNKNVDDNKKKEQMVHSLTNENKQLIQKINGLDENLKVLSQKLNKAEEDIKINTQIKEKSIVSKNDNDKRENYKPINIYNIHIEGIN